MAKKRDIKQVDDVAAAHGLVGPLRVAFGDAVHDAKAQHLYPEVNGMISWKHLNEIAVQFKVDENI